ncbi:hypothetical protein FN846DRAFT_408816, partial [Sphaerosporella brunnea]
RGEGVAQVCPHHASPSNRKTIAAANHGLESGVVDRLEASFSHVLSPRVLILHSYSAPQSPGVYRCPQSCVISHDPPRKGDIKTLPAVRPTSALSFQLHTTNPQLQEDNDKTNMATDTVAATPTAADKSSQLKFIVACLFSNNKLQIDWRTIPAAAAGATDIMQLLGACILSANSEAETKLSVDWQKVADICETTPNASRVRFGRLLTKLKETTPLVAVEKAQGEEDSAAAPNTPPGSPKSKAPAKKGRAKAKAATPRKAAVDGRGKKRKIEIANEEEEGEKGPVINDLDMDTVETKSADAIGGEGETPDAEGVEA